MGNANGKADAGRADARLTHRLLREVLLLAFLLLMGCNTTDKSNSVCLANCLIFGQIVLVCSVNTCICAE